jgi:hypothetical protein
MGILDDAIREHLELKRQHGAADPELKKLEDEAFGPPERPGMAPEDASDPLAEAPTQFMAQPEVSEAPPSATEEPKQRRETAAGILDLQEAPEPGEPAEEEQPAAEHEAVAEPEEEPQLEEEQPQAAEEDEVEAVEQDAEFVQEERGEPSAAEHSTEERHAIAEQPTEHYDIEEELSVSGPSREEATAAGSAPDDEEEDDFFNEQRLSDELDQALEAPREPEPEEELAPADELAADEKPEPEEELAPEEDSEPEPEEEQPPPGREDDVLEGTPDFLEETPEDDELWFEQKPPKDFDFDD